jgi:hypothetical protein
LIFIKKYDIIYIENKERSEIDDYWTVDRRYDHCDERKRQI